MLILSGSELLSVSGSLPLLLGLLGLGCEYYTSPREVPGNPGNTAIEYLKATFKIQLMVRESIHI